jgi:GntR family transcriptional regulator / MocR family aminotransferase
LRQKTEPVRSPDNSPQLHARDLLVRVDRRVRQSVGRQLEEQLRTLLRSGALPPGSDLPSTRALAEDLSVSRGVVVRVYSQLAAEGYLNVRQGALPTVRSSPPLGRELKLPRVAPSAGHPKARYDLRPHLPELSAFPRQAWLRSVRHVLLSVSDAELGYGAAQGLEQLRVEISTYLGRARGVAADPARIVVTAGSTHTLSLIARVLARRGARTIGLENPSSWLMREVVQSAGLTAVGVPVDREGLRVDALAATGVPAVIVSPAHQFPTGTALSAERRAALVLWARETGGLIVEDDYDAEFRYDRAPIGALQGLSPEQVAYVGSASKSLLPGLRLGWTMLPTDFVNEVRLALATSVLQVAAIDQVAFADFVRRGEFDRHLRRMRTVYRRRRDAIVQALDARLPELPISGIAAGLHVVVELDAVAVEAAACEYGLARGLAIESLSHHALPGYGGPPGLLIGYGAIAEPAIPLAVEELAGAVEAAMQSTTRNGRP